MLRHHLFNYSPTVFGYIRRQVIRVCQRKWKKIGETIWWYPWQKTSFGSLQGQHTLRYLQNIQNRFKHKVKKATEQVFRENSESLPIISRLWSDLYVIITAKKWRMLYFTFNHHHKAAAGKKQIHTQA